MILIVEKTKEIKSNSIRIGAYFSFVFFINNQIAKNMTPQIIPNAADFVSVNKATHMMKGTLLRSNQRNLFDAVLKEKMIIGKRQNKTWAESLYFNKSQCIKKHNEFDSRLQSIQPPNNTIPSKYNFCPIMRIPSDIVVRAVVIAIVFIAVILSWSSSANLP